MNLENIVPSLDDCKRIPQGSFPDSVLVLVKHCENGIYKWLVMERDKGRFYKEQYPALTHEEICMDINRITGEKIVTSCCGGFWIVSVRINGDSLVVRAQNPATAALRLWFRLKGVQG